MARSRIGDVVSVLRLRTRQERARRQNRHPHQGNRRRRRDDGGGGTDCSDLGDCCPCDGFSLAALVLAVGGARRADARDPHTTTPRSAAARAASRLVRSYQVNVSVSRPPVCPMTPSCSRYALTALSRHGAVRGGSLVVRRLWRCDPRRGGADPVPS